MTPSPLYHASLGFPSLLRRLGVSLAVSGCQSGQLLMLGCGSNGELLVQDRHFHRAMGLWSRSDTLLLASLFQIHRFENILTPGQFINHRYDRCYVPRASYATGAIDLHDVGMVNGNIVFVNTAYNCISTLSPRHSFKALWKPAFIDALVPEDRCHLNGMAIEGDKVRYVTAISDTNIKDAWRECKAEGGIVIDVPNNAIICRGLSMPHSPRMHAGKLWVLNSGTGEFGYVENERFHAVTFVPGFARGLSFHGDYAFIGMSRPRHEGFDGLPIGDRLEKEGMQPVCGVQVVDLHSGSAIGQFSVNGSMSEVFDVAVIAGAACPMSVGFQSGELLTLISHEEALPVN